MADAKKRRGGWKPNTYPAAQSRHVRTADGRRNMSKDSHRSPLWCIRQKCLDCVGRECIREMLTNCEIPECKLHPYRSGHRPKEWPADIHPKRFSPRRVIKKYCLDCCLGSRHERKLCPATDCPLWKWREGTPPEYKKQVTARNFPAVSGSRPSNPSDEGVDTTATNNCCVPAQQSVFTEDRL